ncbi:alkaline phosphatase [Lampropedia cohaerens]|uniref:Alkaline phosphatase n=1 Tax=Lampropedia cohaerens TaxID=1610491 RepID=A0A0U1PYL2_9BURK|nr:choice-of-anchor I family protein [Lampropedia cohaerens]KKW67556.1 alkaline phosphatase [Lampropedia cohaerens]
MPTTHLFPHASMLRLTLVAAAVSIALTACGGGDDDEGIVPPPPVVNPGDNDNGGGSEPAPQPPAEVTPGTVELELIGRYASGVFGKSAAEIPAFDAASKRAFIVNSDAGALDVLDLSDPSNPRRIDTLHSEAILAGSSVNSVASHNGLVAIAIEAANKTDKGHVALYQAADLQLLGQVEVGALPDNLVFTPDGNTLLVANEGEPSDDYQIDPEGSVTVIDIRVPTSLSARTAGFSHFNSQADALRAKGVRIFGPNATVAQDVEPEYIAVSADSSTAWVALQENNALAKLDIASATITDILPLGYKDHGNPRNAIDVSDGDGDAELIEVDIKPWPGLVGMYMPDGIATYTAPDGKTYIITANEGDARAWGEEDADYIAGDASKGFVEQWRVKHLVHKNGFDRRAGDDLPPQLRALAAGALLNPEVFAYCGATPGDPGDCRDDTELGRLTVTWTEGYRKDATGNPVMFNAQGQEDPNGDRLMYDQLYAFGARSIAIWDENVELIWESGAQFERFIANQIPTRNGKWCTLFNGDKQVDCVTFFNANHEEGASLDNRSDNKGPEPEGVTVGVIGEKTFAFVGLERFGGVMVYDVTNPRNPTLEDYINTRTDWTTADLDALDWPTEGDAVGDLGPEGLVFVPAQDSPNGEPLLLVGNEVSGTTSIFKLNLQD